MSSSVEKKIVYRSETSKHRETVAPFCCGFGIDIGFGGDPVSRSAIRVDLPQPYAYTGESTVQLGGDCRDLKWFRSDVLDYVYSSHVLEDFDTLETEEVLREWVRVIRPGGRLVLLLPDQQLYKRHCLLTGQPYNSHHSIDDFSSEYVKGVADKLGNLRILHEVPYLGEYSFLLIFEKTAADNAEYEDLAATRLKLEKSLNERDQIKLAHQTVQQRLNALEQSASVKVVLRLYRLKRRILTLVNRKIK